MRVRNMFSYLGELSQDGIWIAWVPFLFLLTRRARDLIKSRIWVPALFGFIATFLVFHAMANISAADPFYRGILSRFWSQAHLCFFLFAGLGVAAYLKRAARKGVCRWAVIAVALLAARIATEVPRLHFTRHDLFPVYATQIFETLPQNAVLLTCGDVVTNSVHFFQHVEKMRGDVAIMQIAHLKHAWYHRWLQKKYPFLTTSPSGTSLVGFLDQNFSTRPIYAAGELCNFDDDPELPRKYGEIIEGCAHRIVRRSDTPESLEEYEKGSQKLFSCLAGIPPQQFPADTWERGLFAALDEVRGAYLARMQQFLKKHPSEPLQNRLRDLAGHLNSMGLPGTSEPTTYR